MLSRISGEGWKVEKMMDSVRVLIRYNNDNNYLPTAQAKKAGIQLAVKLILTLMIIQRVKRERH